MESDGEFLISLQTYFFPGANYSWKETTGYYNLRHRLHPKDNSQDAVKGEKRGERTDGS